MPSKHPGGGSERRHLTQLQWCSQEQVLPELMLPILSSSHGKAIELGVIKGLGIKPSWTFSSCNFERKNKDHVKSMNYF